MTDESADDSEEHKTLGARDLPAAMSRWEWAFAALGLAIVVFTVAFLAYDWLTNRDAPPEITVAVERVVASKAGYLVTFSAHNAGGAAAIGVDIEGTLRAGAEVRERATVTLDALPSRSTRRGGLYFETDPATLTLSLRALGYQEP